MIDEVLRWLDKSAMLTYTRRHALRYPPDRPVASRCLVHGWAHRADHPATFAAAA
jgi:hypothetical protein